MSEPIDQTNATDVSAARRKQVLRDLDQWLEEGVTVFDLNRETVGGVTGYSTTSGYLMVGPGGFNNKSLFIPFRFIERVDQQGFYLTLLKDAWPSNTGSHRSSRRWWRTALCRVHMGRYAAAGD